MIKITLALILGTRACVKDAQPETVLAAITKLLKRIDATGV